MNGFTWLLISFPVYLLAKKRLSNYFTLASGVTGTTSAQKPGSDGSGLDSNQAVV